jgi:hypothetical protein
MDEIQSAKEISHPMISTFQHPRLKKGKIVTAEKAGSGHPGR